ncbi:MAG: hypothetical protein Q8Q04_02435, partial [archaeon]|nr:hypothetical protein [archaeon]
LREKCRPSPRYKKTPKAIKTVKEFLVRHMKIRDGDLKKIRIDINLNEQLWMRGIKKPVHKIKVKAVKEGDIVRVYSANLPPKINFKKLRGEKMEIQAKADAEKKKTMMEKAKETLKGKKEPAEEISEESVEKTDEEKKDEKEKEESSKISQEQLEKDKAKEMKHKSKINSPGQKKAERKGYDITSRGH